MYIPTLNDVLKDQEKIDLLCADRELKTKELFSGNAFYGHDKILKEYAGLPAGYPLKFVIPHGICFSDTFLWDAEINNQLPAVLSYQNNRGTIYSEGTKGTKKILIGAAPIVYVPELIDINANNKREGTIFFPAHSTHLVTTTMNYGRLAEWLKGLDAKYQPVTVCVYWRDFNLGHYKPFEDIGLKIVSAGHIYDPAFLFRLYHLCSEHRFSGCNNVGSHIFYAQLAGCQHFCMQSDELIITADKHVQSRDIASPSSRITEVMSLFSFPPKGVNKNAKDDLLDDYLNISCKKTKWQLRRSLLSCEFMYLSSRISAVIK